MRRQWGLPSLYIHCLVHSLAPTELLTAETWSWHSEGKVNIKLRITYISLHRPLDLKSSLSLACTMSSITLWMMATNYIRHLRSNLQVCVLHRSFCKSFCICRIACCSGKRKFLQNGLDGSSSICIAKSQFCGGAADDAHTNGNGLTVGHGKVAVCLYTVTSIPVYWQVPAQPMEF